jgi:hypothetical protein
VEDAVGGRAQETHEAALKVMRNIFTVVKTTDAIEMLKGENQ